jgi:hypothetical protein
MSNELKRCERKQLWYNLIYTGIYLDGLLKTTKKPQAVIAISRLTPELMTKY